MTIGVRQLKTGLNKVMGRNLIARVSKTCGHRQADSGRIKPGSETVNSRVGKGRPAGSNELRVSPSPSKIPYGGFSPVRLQMDRPWRPSTTSRGLSAVHIRPMTPSYTPPQLRLPGIRDPRRDYPFENLSVQCGTIPSNSTRPSRGPWLAIGLCCPVGSSLTTASSAPLNSSPPLMDLRRGLLHPRKRPMAGIQRVPNLLGWTVLACRLPYPGGPEGCA